jgi:hypothetical protein
MGIFIRPCRFVNLSRKCAYSLLSTISTRRECETWKLWLAERCFSSLGAVAADITISPECGRIDARLPQEVTWVISVIGSMEFRAEWAAGAWWRWSKQ